MALLLTACLLVSACDSSKEEATPSEDLSAMFVDVQSAISLALTAGISKAHAPLVERDCPEGGTLDVTTNGSGNNLDLSIAFQNCNGIDGTLSMVGSQSFSGSDFNYELTMNGTLDGQCAVSYNDYQQSISTNTSTGGTSVTMNGQISATCSGGSTTCSFNDTPLDVNGGNANVFADNCN